MGACTCQHTPVVKAADGGVIPVHPACRCRWLPVHRAPEPAEPDLEAPLAEPPWANLATTDPAHPWNMGIKDALAKTNSYARALQGRLKAVESQYAARKTALTRTIRGATGRKDWPTVLKAKTERRALAVQQKEAMWKALSYGDDYTDDVFALFKEADQVHSHRQMAGVMGRAKKAANVWGRLMGKKPLARVKQSGWQCGVSWEKGVRGYYQPNWHAMVVSDLDKYDVLVHEFAHFVDHVGGRGARVRSFLTYRTKGLKRTMYHGHKEEWVKGDKFIDEYIGSLYPGNHANEVMSMGVQFLIKDPIKFARRDFEHFNFVISYLRGWL